MINAIKSYFDPGQRILSKYKHIPAEVRENISRYENKSEEELVRIIGKYREELAAMTDKITDEQKQSIKMRKRSEGLPKNELDIYNRLQQIVPSVFAIMSLVSKKTYGMMHFDVQLLAGAVLASGQKLVEMKTGEGKTFTFQLPLFLYGLTGRGAHLVTVNDYLARRDGEYAGHLFSRLGVSVGIITPQVSYKFVSDDELKKVKGETAWKDRQAIKEIKLSTMRGVNLVEVDKKTAYGCDVVFGTNNEFGFDYLRDNMVKSMNRRVQGELYFCIVDEADSILIDEARTPLIISQPATDSNDLYKTFADLVPELKEERDYVIEEKEKAVNLTDAGIERMEKLLGVKNIWEDYRMAHHLENALKAMVFYRKDKEYIVRNGEVLIVDEFTGRVLPGRRYSEGLHQAIEAKEDVVIQQESRTLATITFQNFFRLYKILAGGSGTVMTEQEEFFKIYNLEATAIPTNKPLIRKDESDRIYKNKQAKFNAVVGEIVKAHEKGQPILVGTTSIADSELLSSLLEKHGIEHEVLNAKHHEREAQIVAKAGEVNAVTVATNMAGRGTDIPLGKGAVEAGGLYVIGTERHESRRIDNQLRGRSGRQGDPGKTRFFVSLDDQIMRIQGGDIIRRIMEMTNLPEDLPIESRMVTRSIERAQKRMEGMYFDSRKHVVEYDDVVNQQRQIFYMRRLRYLLLAEKFEELAGKDKNVEEVSESLAEAKKKLSDLFKEALEDLADRYSFEIYNFSGDRDALEKVVFDSVDEIMSLGVDELLIETANYLKLYKTEIKDSGNLRKVLADEMLAKKDEQIQLREFLENYLRTAINLKINRTKNLSGLIKTIFLDVMDEMWTLHLDFMQDIREGIGLRGVAQLDPLVEYRNEGYQAFSSFVSRVNNQALQGLLQVKEIRLTKVDESPIQNAVTNAEQIAEMLTGSREMINAVQQEGDTDKASRKVVVTKVGRNDPCFCGSGKKYKKCGLKNTPEHIKNMQLRMK